MTRIVKFTFYIKQWLVDLTDILEDSEDPHHADVIKLFRLLDMESRTKSEKKLLPIREEIFQLLNLELDVDFDCGKIFSNVPSQFSVPINSETAPFLSFWDDGDNYYGFGGDINFELEANCELTNEIMEEWEMTTHAMSPNINWKFGEYASDDGRAELSWEIEEE